MAIKNVVFDLGGVLIKWDPRACYRRVFNNDEQMEYFLNNICTSAWNAQMDKGRTFDECIAELSQLHPEYSDKIALWKTGWIDMLCGTIPEGMALFNAIRASGKYTCYALTNWATETFPIACRKFPFLHDFEGIVVSGEEKMIKPEKGLYLTLLERYHLNPEECLFIDDKAENIVTAKSRGMTTLLFKNPAEDAQKAAKLLKIKLSAA